MISVNLHSNITKSHLVNPVLNFQKTLRINTTLNLLITWQPDQDNIWQQADREEDHTKEEEELRIAVILQVAAVQDLITIQIPVDIKITIFPLTIILGTTTDLRRAPTQATLELQAIQANKALKITFLLNTSVIQIRRINFIQREKKQWYQFGSHQLNATKVLRN